MKRLIPLFLIVVIINTFTKQETVYAVGLGSGDCHQLVRELTRELPDGYEAVCR